jgi:Flp pilus assembly protein TadG
VERIGFHSEGEMMGRLLRCTRATAAVEAAIFAPIFLLFVLGITDLGSGMFVRMAVNAATQAGASYAVVKAGSTCASLTSTCLAGIKAAMVDATGNSSFCAGSVCSASIAACADGGAKCIIVEASYPFAPLLPDRVYSWAQSMTIASTVTIRTL